MSEYIVDNVRDFLQKLLPGMGLEIFDIQFRREGHGWVLRIFIDSRDGVTLDQCTGVSRELSQYLDVEDLIDHAYHLEVSSPGLERPLRSVDDFCRFAGENARVKLSVPVDGEKFFEGTIEEVQGNVISLKGKDKKSVRFSYEAINKARLII